MASIDFGRAFGSPYKDPNWIVKTLLGGLFTIIPIVNFVVGGALVERIKAVAGGDETLPEWSDFGSMWVTGLMVAIAGFIYMLPAILIMLIGIVPGCIAAVASGGNDSSGGVAALAGGSICIFYAIALIYAIAASIFFYAAMTNYAIKGNFGSFFAFGEIMGKVREGNYFMAWIFAVVATFVYGLVSIIPILGWILVLFAYYLGFMTSGHVLGQWAAEVYGMPGPGGAVPATPGVPGYPPSGPPRSMPTAPPAAPSAPAPWAPPMPPAAPPAPPAPPAAPSSPPMAPTPPAAAPPAPSAAPPAPPAPPTPPMAPGQ
jgi:hypothetical protein